MRPVVVAWAPFLVFVVLVSLLGCLVDFVLACLILPPKVKKDEDMGMTWQDMVKV